ncbi:MAG: prolyl oligopeptidase family serine peptidase [Elusimicrobiota bacterium]
MDLLLVLLCAAAHAGPLPFDLAYRTRQLTRQDVPSPSPDGRFIAYAVLTPPGSNERFLPNGTPGESEGSRIHISETESGRTWDACPEQANCWRPSWSPDSSRLAFYSDKDGRPRLWIHSLAERESRRASKTIVKPKLWWGDQPRWSPDGKRVFIPAGEERPAAPDARKPESIIVRLSGPDVKEDKSPAESFYMDENASSLAVIEAATGKTRMLVSSAAAPAPSVLRVSPSGRWVSYTSVYRLVASTGEEMVSDLAVVPSTGGVTRVVARDLKHQAFDFLGQDNYQWHPSDDRLVYWKDGKAWLVDLRGGQPASPQELGPELGGLEPYPLLFSMDGLGLLVGTKDGLASIPLGGGPARKLPVPWDSPGVLRAGDGTFYQPEPGACLISGSSDGERTLARLDLSAGDIRALWKGNGRISTARASKTDGFFAVYTDSQTSPDIRWFPGDLSSSRRLTRIEPGLDSVPTGVSEYFETQVPRPDGSTITVRSAVVLPVGSKRREKLPAVVVVYPGVNLSHAAREFGGGDAGQVPALLFTSRGYAVLLTDIPLKRQDGQPVREAVDMLLPQLRRAAELGYIDPGRLALLGHSYGGYMAAAIASRTQDFRAVVSISGDYDLGAHYGMTRKDGTSFGVNWSESGQGRMGVPPWADPKRYIENSPYYQADKIQAALLMIKGDQDDFGEVQDAQRMFTAMRRLGKTAQLAVYPGEGHEPKLWSVAHGTDAAERIAAFVERYLSRP